MSLIITLNLAEGIIMASDSRLTAQSQSVDMYKNLFDPRHFKSDHYYKTLLLGKHFGISMYGKSHYEGMSVEQCLQEVEANFPKHRLSVKEVADRIGLYFHQLDPFQDSGFHVTGFDLEEGTAIPKVFRVLIQSREPLIYQMNYHPKANALKLGGIWNGDTSVIERLYSEVSMRDMQGNTIVFPKPPIPWKLMSLQDGIDFCKHLISTTHSVMRFSGLVESVGGAIDVLILKSDEVKWHARKNYTLDNVPFQNMN